MTDINVNALAEAINDKMDTDLGNTSSNPDIDTFLDILLSKGVDVVVESQAPTAANSYTWYRKYKSGWVEQGGEINHETSAYDWSEPISFPIVMADTHYTYYVTPSQDSGTGCMCGITQSTKTTAGCTFWQSSKANASGKSTYISWQVSGMAASSSNSNSEPSGYSLQD